ncbi:MAG: glycoside hydrolase family 99-like domain-containing protein [Acidobacteriaceae bacterium]|nr:glycoside hydrolase family 99-like domain-containing protein [Acidobacteriaceae bacterium]
MMKIQTRYSPPLVAAVLLIGTKIAASGPMPGLSDTRTVNVRKEVLAFYYGWYGNPDVSKRWFHWKNVDVTKKHIDESTHFPVLGAYDSHDPTIVEAHCREAKQAGLTGFIVSWWRQGDFHDAGIPLMLDTAEKYGLKVSVYYETVPPPGDPTIEGAIGDFRYIIQKYSSHPAWLKVDGRPVIFIYSRAINQLKLSGWRTLIESFNAKYGHDPVFVGDRISPEAAQVFDGMHTYNPTGETKGMTVEQIRRWAGSTFPEWVRTAGRNKIACVTIIPGYDDSCQPTRKPPRPITERHQGATYKAMWEAAIATDPDWVLITSWNEWHEGSEIEPSVENGDTDLKITKRYAKKFRALPVRN